MELNLAMRSVRRRGTSCRLGRPPFDGFYGNFALRETRSSYFLLIRGRLSTDEIEVEMDKERSLILRGESYCKELGMVKWKYRLMMSTRRTPFRIPEDVNVGATRGIFQQHNLHVVMPKFTRRSRMSPHHVIHIHSSTRQLLKSLAAVKVNQSSSCSYYTGGIINKDTFSSSTSSSVLSNAEGKIQQYQRRRRRSINKVTANSQ